MSTIQYQAVVTRVPSSTRKGPHTIGFLQPPRGSVDWPSQVSRAGLSFLVDNVKGGTALFPGCTVQSTLMRGMDKYMVEAVYAQKAKSTSSPSVASSTPSTASGSRTPSSSSSYSSYRLVRSTARPVIAAPGLSQMPSWRSPGPPRPALRRSKALSRTDLHTAYEIGLLQKSHTF